MNRADENKKTEKAAEQDGRKEVRCRCNDGGNCHRAQHKEGIQCERMIIMTPTSRHRICKGCRSSKKRKVCSEDVERTSVDNEGGDEARDLASPGQSEEGSADSTALNDSTTDHPYPKRRRGRPSKSKNSANDTTAADSVEEQPLTTRDGHAVTPLPCACVGGGSKACYHKGHLKGKPCTNICRISKNVRHRVCKSCRSRPKASGSAKSSPKSKRKRRSSSEETVMTTTTTDEDQVENDLFKAFDLVFRSDEDGVTSQDSGGESISSDESLIDDGADGVPVVSVSIIDVAEIGPLCLPCQETEY